MTFAATSLAVIHAGAEPVWVDVEKETGNINADLIEGAVTEKTKAVLPVHLYGQMCDMKRIRKIADRHGLAVIEDCAHSLESERDGIRAGELADAACFSFYATKSITCGEGGALTTNSGDLAEKTRRMRTHGINKEAADRYTGRFMHWDLLDIGLKCNMSDIQAALLIPQLSKVEIFREMRKKLHWKYVNSLSPLAGVSMPQILPGSKSGYHLFTLWIDPLRRDELLYKLQDAGIGVAVNYRSINLLTAFLKRYAKKRGSYPVAERIGDSTISLPFHAKMADDELAYVVDHVKAILSSNEGIG
jgi:dTDP-4-amino-4,6-dideoxygalactose transaminase